MAGLVSLRGVQCRPIFAQRPGEKLYAQRRLLLATPYQQCALSRVGRVLLVPLKAAAADKVDTMELRQYEFTAEDEVVFEELKHAMEDTCKFLLLAAGTSVVALLVPSLFAGALPHFTSEELQEAAPVLAATVAKVSTAGLLYFSAKKFEQVYKTTGNDLDNLLDGLRMLTNSMQELAILETAVSVLNVACASAIWSETSILLAGVLGVVSIGRVALYSNSSLLRQLRRLPIGAQQAVIVALAPVMGREAVAATQRTMRVKRAMDRKNSYKRTSSSRDLQSAPSIMPRTSNYEFSTSEDNVFRDLVTCLFFCAMSFWGAATSTLLLTAAEGHHGASLYEMGEEAFHFVDHVAVAVLLIRATGCFDKVILTSGNDVKNLLEGLGMECGMAKLFEELANVNKIVAFLTVVKTGFVVTNLLH